jgi:hypothetical protein
MALAKLKLSGSTDGKPIKVAATAIGSGTTIHTAQSGTSFLDEIWLWVSNTDSVERTLTIGHGGTTDPDDLTLKAVTIAANSGPQCISPGLPLQNSLIVKAAASVANVLTITGHVNRQS